jgi:neutral ceramidase
VPSDASPGSYRIVHHGAARDRSGRLTQFTGRTREFAVG